MRQRKGTNGSVLGVVVNKSQLSIRICTLNMIVRLLINILALLLIAYFIPGIEVDGFITAFIVAVLLGLLNIFIKPILVILTLPITIITLGLFTFVINAALFWFVASFVEGFYVDGFLFALLGTILYSIISGVGNKLVD